MRGKVREVRAWLFAARSRINGGTKKDFRNRSDENSSAGYPANKINQERIDTVNRGDSHTAYTITREKKRERDGKGRKV